MVAADLELAAAGGDVDELVLAEDAPPPPVEVVGAGMAAGRVGCAGRDARLPGRGQVEAPEAVPRADREVAEEGLEASRHECHFVHKTGHCVHCLRRRRC